MPEPEARLDSPVAVALREELCGRAETLTPASSPALDTGIASAACADPPDVSSALAGAENEALETSGKSASLLGSRR